MIKILVVVYLILSFIFLLWGAFYIADKIGTAIEDKTTGININPWVLILFIVDVAVFIENLIILLRT